MALKKLSTALILVALAASAMVLAVATSGVLNSYQTLHSQGALTPLQSTVNIGVYSDSGCTQNATSVNWGTIARGNGATRTVWIKNTGNVNSTLSMITSGWTPANANPGITLTWDRENAVVAPNGVVQATLSLNVSPDLDAGITTFAFNIQVTGTGS